MPPGLSRGCFYFARTLFARTSYIELAVLIQSAHLRTRQHLLPLAALAITTSSAWLRAQASADQPSIDNAAPAIRNLACKLTQSELEQNLSFIDDAGLYAIYAVLSNNAYAGPQLPLPHEWRAKSYS